MDLLQRSWFKCRTCGIDCSTEVLATYTPPDSDTPTSWDECTTCATPCEECQEPADIHNIRYGHSGHDDCTMLWCEALNRWANRCDWCDMCYNCDHCDDCQNCDCDCWRRED